MQDLEVRLIECVVHCYCCPGVNEFRHRTAALQRAPPAGSTGKLHLHQQQVVLQRDGHRGRTEGCGEREARATGIQHFSCHFFLLHQ